MHGYLECTPCPEARCGPPFVVIFLFTLGSWTIPHTCVMLFEAFVFANSSCCNLLSLTVEVLFFNSFTIRKTKIRKIDIEIRESIESL